MKSNDYNFSVLMSVYFKENANYFEQSLNSVLNQTLKPNEIVLVKDGPLTPELEIIILKYLKKHKKLFKIISLEKNRGLGIALNIGLPQCKNEIVARMDTDDIAVSDRFEKQINIFKQYNVDLVGGLIREYDEEMINSSGIRMVPEKHSQILKYLKKRNAFNHMTVMYKKSAVLSAGGYQDCPFFEDYYLWCKMAKNNCSFYNIQEILVNVRGGNLMIDRRGGKNYNKCIRNFYDKIYDLGIVNGFEKFFYSNIRLFFSSFSFFRKVAYKRLLRRK